jgi:hypothetical protein
VGNSKLIERKILYGETTENFGVCGFGGIRCLGHLRSILSVPGGGEMTNEKMRNLLENLGASLFDTLKKLYGEIGLVTGTRR